MKILLCIAMLLLGVSASAFDSDTVFTNESLPLCQETIRRIAQEEIEKAALKKPMREAQYLTMEIKNPSIDVVGDMVVASVNGTCLASRSLSDIAPKAPKTFRDFIEIAPWEMFQFGLACGVIGAMVLAVIICVRMQYQ